MIIWAEVEIFMGILNFYKLNLVDKNFDEKEYAEKNPNTEGYYQPFCKDKGIDDKHRLYYHSSISNYSRKSQDIESFLNRNSIPKNFDSKLYLDLNPSAKNFYKNYCDKVGISDHKRLFYHSQFYGKGVSLQNLLKLENEEHLKIKKIRDLEKKSIDEFLPPHELYLSQYNHYLDLGKQKAQDSKIAVVGLARDCAIQLSKSISDLQKFNCKQLEFFIFENDSVDETKDVLKQLTRDYSNIEVTFAKNNREYLRDRSRERTINLAEYRNFCLGWVKENCSDFNYVIVLDLDADLGFSLEGIYNSIGWFDDLDNAGGMCSYSLYLKHGRNITSFVHYDSFAARLNDWKPTGEDSDQNNVWFRELHPLIGSEPFHLYSCFGGLAVYKTEAFISGRYCGSLGSEHVFFHKELYENGFKIYLNPSSRFFSVYENYLNEE